MEVGDKTGFEQFPICPTCELAYAYVRRLSLSEGWIWVWERECKHKSLPVLKAVEVPVDG